MLVGAVLPGPVLAGPVLVGPVLAGPVLAGPVLDTDEGAGIDEGAGRLGPRAAAALGGRVALGDAALS